MTQVVSLEGCEVKQGDVGHGRARSRLSGVARRELEMGGAQRRSKKSTQSVKSLCLWQFFLRAKRSAPMYYRGSAVCLVVYDITNEDFLAAAKTWVAEICQGTKAAVSLAGNESDLEARRCVSSTARQFSEAQVLAHSELSARTGQRRRPVRGGGPTTAPGADAAGRGRIRAAGAAGGASSGRVLLLLRRPAARRAPPAASPCGARGGLRQGGGGDAERADAL
ncbi:unnamed protein product [Prorocentrum cordatum]|uniref:Uncharacterized protein n=1 Tax=Prorocentrum cordatum TaxID=2364126 RepID=A0ABN9VNB1_9DINO|nr:unnamed protein product [Polarella glacialis]